MRFYSCSFFLVCISIVFSFNCYSNETSNSCPHSLLTDNPGKVYIHLWGWETCTDYQRLNKSIVSPDYLKRRAVDESYKCGANILELFAEGYSFSLDEEYPREVEGGWNKKALADLHRYVHSKDMIIHWFPHWFGDRQSSPLEVAGIFRGIMQQQQDCLVVPTAELADGIGTEQWTNMWALLFNKCVWPYDPVKYYYSDTHVFRTTLPNEMDVTASNGTGADDLTTGFYRTPRKLEKKYGLQFWAGQAESRSRNYPDHSSRYAIYGGLGTPDWILKQVNDQSRIRARAYIKNEMVSPSAIWWISDTDYLCPDENRRYVYGASQDPIKCAVTASLNGLGQGGKVTWNGRTLEKRFELPAQTSFVQNNYLRLYSFADKDESYIQFDPQRLAHYDSNSSSFPILDRFAQLTFMNDKGDFDPGEFLLKDAQYIEPAGYKSVMQADYQIGIGKNVVQEKRTYTVLNDNPYLKLNIDRIQKGKQQICGTSFSIKGYDKITVNGKTYSSSASFKPYDIIKLNDSSGKNPVTVIMLLKKGSIHQIHFEPDNELTLEAKPVLKDEIELAVALAQGLYDNSSDLKYLYKHISTPEQVISLGSEPYIVRNDLDIPVTQIVRITDAADHPYYIKEFGHWYFRGAQPSKEYTGDDYVKCYLPAKGTAVIQPYGYIEDAVKIGWGCQYTTLISDVKHLDNEIYFDVKVDAVTSFIFAPRIEMKENFEKVYLNGEKWDFHDGRIVFLPNHTGVYDLKVVKGNSKAPVLKRTYAHIDECNYENKKLEFSASIPIWCHDIPEDFNFTALIEHEGHFIKNIENAELVRDKAGYASIIRFKPGRVVMNFTNSEANAVRAKNDSQEQIYRYLCEVQANQVIEYLNSFDNHKISFDQISQDSDLQDFDLLIWNDAFLHAVPPKFTSQTAAAIRKFIDKGKGLLLIGDGIRILPQIMNRQQDFPRTRWQRIGLQVSYEDIGIEVMAEFKNHPIFSDLEFMNSRQNTFTIIDLHWWELFKTFNVGQDSELFKKASLLARVFPNRKSENGALRHNIAPDAAVLQWQLGNGKILSFNFSLLHRHGSYTMKDVNENLTELVNNSVNYLGNGESDIKIGVITW